eukprot:2340052-Rhodomonas_salina.3
MVLRSQGYQGSYGLRKDGLWSYAKKSYGPTRPRRRVIPARIWSSPTGSVTWSRAHQPTRQHCKKSMATFHTSECAEVMVASV